MNALLIGAGSVAQGILSCLQKAQFGRPAIVARGRALESLRSGLKRTGLFGDHYSPPESFDICETIDQAPDKIGAILVCSKAFDTDAIVDQILASKFGSTDIPLILCQNGWGSADAVAAKLDTKRIFNARIITGFCRPNTNTVAITVHADDIRIGNIFHPEEHSRFDELADAISRGGIKTSTSAELVEFLWSKMLYNCALNPLGAVLKATYGELASSSDTRWIMNQVIDEVFLVMQECGFRTHFTSADDYKASFYDKMVPLTASHRSSMLQDITSGKRTEIDFLSGRIVTLGAQRGIQTPANLFLTRSVKFLESLPCSLDVTLSEPATLVAK
jgi:2-dehydropantoate 2-reductase